MYPPPDQEYTKVKKNQKKLQALYIIFFKLKAKMLLRYFFRWKLISQMDVNLHQRYLQRTVKFRYLVKLSKDRYMKMIRDTFYVWYFQCKQGFPFYNKTQKVQLQLVNTIEKIREKEQRRRNQRVTFHVHEIYFGLERLVMPLESKLTVLKCSVLRQFKCLYEIERIVINSQQSVMVRTLSVNMELYFHYFSKMRPGRKDLGPIELLNIMEHSYSKKGVRVFGETDYLDKFLTRMEVSKTRIRDSDILVTGIWATPNPLFRLREYIFVKLVQRTYIKWINVTMLKLRFNKQLAELKDRERREMELKNTTFRKTWARIFLAYSIISKVELISGDVLIAYEFAKKKMEIDNSKLDSPSSMYQKQINQIQDIPDYEELIRESFKKRLAESKKLFAKKFLGIILNPSEKPKDVKRELTSLLIDTLYYVTCGALRSVTATPRERLF